MSSIHATQADDALKENNNNNNNALFANISPVNQVVENNLKEKRIIY